MKSNEKQSGIVYVTLEISENSEKQPNNDDQYRFTICPKEINLKPDDKGVNIRFTGQTEKNFHIVGYGETNVPIVNLNAEINDLDGLKSVNQITIPLEYENLGLCSIGLFLKNKRNENIFYYDPQVHNAKPPN